MIEIKDIWNLKDVLFLVFWGYHQFGRYIFFFLVILGSEPGPIRSRHKFTTNQNNQKFFLKKMVVLKVVIINIQFQWCCFTACRTRTLSIIVHRHKTVQIERTDTFEYICLLNINRVKNFGVCCSFVGFVLTVRNFRL